MSQDAGKATQSHPDEHEPAAGGSEIARSSSVDTMLREMDEALGAELDKVVRTTRGHRAIDGHSLGNAEGQAHYTFTLPEPWEPADDAPIIVKWFAHTQGIEGTVITSTGTRITITTSSPLPDEALR